MHHHLSYDTHSISCFQILELYHALKRKQGIILTGQTGSGKSTCYNVLAKVMVSLHNRPQDLSPEEEGALVHDLSLKKAHTEQKLKVRKRQSFTQLSSLLSVLHCFLQEHNYGTWFLVCCQSMV